MRPVSHLGAYHASTHGTPVTSADAHERSGRASRPRNARGVRSVILATAMEERTQPVSAWSLLRADWRGAVSTCLLTATSMVLAILLVGVGLFAFAAARQLRRHVRLAFGSTGRGWGAALAVAVGALVLAVLVAGSWVSMVDHLWPRADLVTPPPIPFLERDELIASGLLVFYLLIGWLLTPVLFVAVIACDPAAPRSWRDRLSRALRATFRLPVWARLGALLLSALVLVGPLLLFLVRDDPALLMVVFACWSAHLPVLSALLVSRYAAVRDELASDEVRVLHVPGLLILFAVVAAALSVPAFFRGSLAQLLVLAIGWFVGALAFYGYVGAHRMGKLAGGDVRAPGRRAVEGTIEDRRLRTAEGLAFAIPPERAETLSPGVPYTLVADFGAYRESFRESADQPWPKGGVLHEGRLADLLEERVQGAIWRTWLALGAVTVIAVATIL
jgi:hypothetical protein